MAVLLTIIFAFLTGVNALNFLRKGIFYASEDGSFKNTPAFANEILNTILTISTFKDVTDFYDENVTYEKYLQTDKAKEIMVSYDKQEERAIKLFNTIQELKKLRPKTIETNNGTYNVDENGVVYFPEEDSYIAAHEFYNHYNSYYYDGEYSEQATSVYYDDDTEIAYPSNDEELFAIKDKYTSYSDWNYKYQQLRSAIFSIVDNAVSVEQIKEELKSYENESLSSSYTENIEYITEKLNKFVNVKFILKNNKSGQIISNVDKNERKSFLNNLKNDQLYYIDFDGKKLNSSANKINYSTNLLKFLTDAYMLQETAIDESYLLSKFQNYSLHLKIDDTLIPGDSYYTMHGAFLDVKSSDANNYLTLTVLFALLSLVCFVFCCIISGRRKDGSVKLAPLDKIPFVLYLAVTCFFVGVICVYIFWMGIADFSPENIGIDSYSPLKWIITNNFILSTVGLGFALVSLFLLSFVLYIVRNVKAGTFGNRFITIFLTRKIKSGVRKTKAKLSEKEVGPEQIKRQIKRQTIIPIIVYIAMNVFLYVISFSDAYPVAIICLIIFNTMSIVYALLYLSDILRLSKIAEETRNGNFNKKIEPRTFVAPLRKFAVDLDACRDGIENAINEAIKGEHLKTELITNVSHDLKTPLTSIINYVSLLKMGNIEGEEERKYIDILDEKSKKLKRLIEDLTEASKANSGNIKMNVTQVNLNEMALQAVGENSDVLENAGLDVILTERDKEIIVSADSQHTFRIIDNLFSNAKKYSLTGTRVYVDVYKENSFGVFEMKNISRDKLNIDPDELTERFVRGDNSRTTDGSGLGLSIARSFAELQNGIFNIEIDGDMFKAVVKLPLI